MQVGVPCSVSTRWSSYIGAPQSADLRLARGFRLTNPSQAYPGAWQPFGMFNLPSTGRSLQGEEPKTHSYSFRQKDPGFQRTRPCAPLSPLPPNKFGTGAHGLGRGMLRCRRRPLLGGPMQKLWVKNHRPRELVRKQHAFKVLPLKVAGQTSRKCIA